MRVIVDTSVWSLALRRRRKDLSPPHRATVLLLREMIVQGDAVLLGIVRQELLTGVTSLQAFEAMRQRLHEFDDLPPDTEDYERAASAANECARRGVSTTTADMLICAMATGRDLPILTLGRDFERYAKHLPIRLVSIS